MTEADEVAGMIQRILPRLHQVVANGSLASKELTESLLYMGMAIQKLVSSREFAEKENGFLDDSLMGLNEIFGNTFADSLRLVIRDLEKTQDLITTYKDRISLKIDDLEKIMGVVKYQRGEEEMYAAAEPLLRAVYALEEYSNLL